MTSHTLYVNWSNGRCPLKSIPLYPSPSLQIYPSLAFDRYSSPNICPSISLPKDISVDIEAHNLSQEQSVPSAHWLPFPPTRSAARSTPQQWLSARDSWHAEISVRRYVGQGLSCDFSPKLYQSLKLLYNEASTTYSTMGFTADVHKARLVALTYCFFLWGKRVEST